MRGITIGRRSVMIKSLLLGVVALGLVLLASGSVSAQATSLGDPEEVRASIAGGPTPPKGHVARYVLPFYTSENYLTGVSRSVTIINVYNQTKKDCEVGVQFQYGPLVTNTCSITGTVSAGTSLGFCSRTVHDPVFPCEAGPTCNPQLTYTTGHAFISSKVGCLNIVVDAQVTYMSDSSDTLVTGTRQLSVVKINQPNLGD
jgi:hypothetical protein